MKPLSEIGAAVVGTGFIGAVHVETLRRLGVSVRGVVASSAQKSAERARELGVPRGYESYEAMLEDERVDVVHVASPNNLHHPQVKAALEAGKHVVCEKPLALSSKESAELLDLALASGVVHAVQFQQRYYPVCQHLKGLLSAGDLGTARLVSGHYLQDWLLNEADWNWRLESEVGGRLRTVGDIGFHWLDLVSFVTGRRVESVLADLATFLETRRRPVGAVETFQAGGDQATEPRRVTTEDCATMLLRLEGGILGCLALSQISPGRKNSLRFEIDGSEAAAAWDSERPDELWLGHRDRPNELLLRDPALLNQEGRAAARLPGGHAEGFLDAFRGLHAAAYDAISAGGPPPLPTYPTFADGHQEMLIGDAVLQSAADGRWVDVQSMEAALK